MNRGPSAPAITLCHLITKGVTELSWLEVDGPYGVVWNGTIVLAFRIGLTMYMSWSMDCDDRRR